MGTISTENANNILWSENTFYLDDIQTSKHLIHEDSLSYTCSYPNSPNPKYWSQSNPPLTFSPKFL